ncbi:MAG: PIG-L family deacetylase [Chloroflexi bacterium]|nr:PIG-L family deacetylase [Chloroflexota bacterium]
MADRTLLAVFAHPDDETFLAGPVLAGSSARGVAVHLCCATPEAPSSPQSAAAQRRASLACAAAALGICRIHHLNYAEADLDALTVDALAGRVRAVIEQARPQVVLTDAAYGSYGHPHHILVHRATVAAVRAIPQATRLYALAFPLPLVRLNALVMRLLGVHTAALGGRPDLNLRAILRGDHPTTARVDVRDCVAARRRAAVCYREEIAAAPLPLKLLEHAPLWVQEWIFGQARFTRLIPPYTPGETVETDLFARR